MGDTINVIAVGNRGACYGISLIMAVMVDESKMTFGRLLSLNPEDRDLGSLEIQTPRLVGWKSPDAGRCCADLRRTFRGVIASNFSVQIDSFTH